MAMQRGRRTVGWLIFALLAAASEPPHAQRPECSGTPLLATEDSTLVATLACAETGPLADLDVGFLRSVAGNGFEGWSGDGGPAAMAMLNLPHGVAVDVAGNVFVADSGNHLVRRVDGQTGVITTIAGVGVAGRAGDGGPATEAMLNDPRRVAIDAAGHVFVADVNNARIRRIDAATGLISTVAGGGLAGGVENVAPTDADFLAIWDRSASAIGGSSLRPRAASLPPTWTCALHVTCSCGSTRGSTPRPAS